MIRALRPLLYPAGLLDGAALVVSWPTAIYPMLVPILKLMAPQPLPTRLIE